jgi:hypothetical protein
VTTHPRSVTALEKLQLHLLLLPSPLYSLSLNHFSY